jgi:hypothetical protein
MKAGALSQAVAHAAFEMAEQELAALEKVHPGREEKITALVLRMLPRAAEVLRERVAAGNLGLRDPRSIIQGRSDRDPLVVARLCRAKFNLTSARKASGAIPAASTSRTRSKGARALRESAAGGSGLIRSAKELSSTGNIVAAPICNLCTPKHGNPC